MRTSRWFAYSSVAIGGAILLYALFFPATAQDRDDAGVGNSDNTTQPSNDTIIESHGVPYVLTMKGVISWDTLYPPGKAPPDIEGGGPIPIFINVTGIMYCKNDYAEANEPFNQFQNGRHGYIEFFYNVEGYGDQRGYLTRINPIIKNDTIELTANYISIYEDTGQPSFTMSVSQGQIQSVIELTEPITCGQNLEHGPHPTQDHYDAKVNSSYVNMNTTYGAYFNAEYESKPLILDYNHYGRAVQTESIKEDGNGYGYGFDFDLDFPNEHNGGPIAYLDEDNRGWIAFREQTG